MYGSYAAAATRIGDRSAAELFREIQRDEQGHQAAFHDALATLSPKTRDQRPVQASTRPGRGAPNLGLARHLDPSSRACHVWVVRGRDRVVPIPVKVMADQNTQLLARLAQLAA